MHVSPVSARWARWPANFDLTETAVQEWRLPWQMTWAGPPKGPGCELGATAGRSSGTEPQARGAFSAVCCGRGKAQRSTTTPAHAQAVANNQCNGTGNQCSDDRYHCQEDVRHG